MKIINLKAQNVKRLAAIEITPDGNMVVIGGENGAGKTSVLDSIAYVLGGKALICDRPIRRGQKEATVRCELSDDLIVTRTFKKSSGNSYLTITSADGQAKLSSPQAILDALFGDRRKLAFDPLKFMGMTPAEQRDMLKNLVGLDFTDLDERRKELYDDRAHKGRDVNGRKTQLDSMPEFPDAPDEEVSIAELVTAVNRSQEQNRLNAEARRTLARKKEAVDSVGRCIAETERQIAQLQETLQKDRASHDILLSELTTLQSECEDLVDIETSGITQQIQTAEQTNKHVQANATKAQLAEQFREAKAEYDRLTREIEAIDADKAERMAQTTFPVEGLSFGEDGVMLNDLPFDQASSAEQLRVSVAMGLAANPKLKVLLIRDGSLLDAQSLAMVADMAAKADAQVWIERVGEGAECSVVIENGQIKSIEGDTDHGNEDKKQTSKSR